MPDVIFNYFPGLSDDQKNRFRALKEIYALWNSRINLISRKDFDNFYIHHVLHSLAIARIISFGKGTRVLDVGTGGGFPGIPLAIMFPEARFSLLDSIEKKIRVVAAVAEEIGLQNVQTVRKRAEEEKAGYNFIISRAVMAFPGFVSLVSKNIAGDEINELRNGIIYLKGGDLSDELGKYTGRAKIWNISDFFSEPFFETKKIVYLPV